MSVLLALEDVPACDALARFFTRSAKIKVVGQARDASATIGQVTAARARIVVLADSLPGMPLLELIEQVKAQNAQCEIVVLFDNPDWTVVAAVLGAGARGCCLKSSSPGTILKAIAGVSQGAIWLDPGMQGLPERARSMPAASAAAEADLGLAVSSLQLPHRSGTRRIERFPWRESIGVAVVSILGASVLIPLILNALDNRGGAGRTNTDMVRSTPVWLDGKPYRLIEIRRE
jgi:DNA-binding NarL/FixJ family response regulator